MNKQKLQIVGIMLATGLLLASSAAAESTIHIESTGDGSAGGGLGTGLNSMVRTILGDDNQHAEDARGAEPIAPEASLMIQAQSAANTTMMAPATAPAPQVFKASLQTRDVADAVMASPMTEDELHTYSTELLTADTHIQSIDTSDTHVRVTYAVPAKIFRFVPVTLRVTAGAYASGETDLAYQWYAFSSKRAASEFKHSLARRVEPLISTQVFSIEDQKALIDALHLELAAKFGSSTRGDQ